MLRRSLPREGETNLVGIPYVLLNLQFGMVAALVARSWELSGSYEFGTGDNSASGGSIIHFTTFRSSARMSRRWYPLLHSSMSLQSEASENFISNPARTSGYCTPTPFRKRGAFPNIN